jgi:hypothetical protein
MRIRIRLSENPPSTSDETVLFENPDEAVSPELSVYFKHHCISPNAVVSRSLVRCCVGARKMRAVSVAHGRQWTRYRGNPI